MVQNLKIKLLLPLLFGLMVIVSLGQGAIAVRSVSDMSGQMEALGGRLEREWRPEGLRVYVEIALPREVEVLSAMQAVLGVGGDTAVTA